MRQLLSRLAIVATMVAAFSATIYSQTPTQNITVTVLPASSVEERIANEMKEKQLRKAAEEKMAADESARIAETNPRTLLSRARTMYIASDTSFFEEDQLQNALRKREEMARWELVMVDGWDKRNIAGILIDIDRPLFTYTFTYKVTHRSTGIILATGKLTAWDGDAAAPLLADRILEEIRKAKGEVKPKK